MTYVFYLIESLLAVNLLVLVHEIGHMLAGRLFGVPALRLSIGLGPRLAGIRRKGTDYSLAPIPLGGFVELEHGHRHDEKTVCMDCLAPWKRMVVFFSGPAANLSLVLVIFWGVYVSLGYQDREPVVSAVVPGSPAERAGLTPRDRLLEIDGQPVNGWGQAIACLKGTGGEPVAVAVRRDVPVEGGQDPAGHSFQTVVLQMHAGQWKGVEPAGEPVRFRLGPGDALTRSFESVKALSLLLWQSVSGLVTAKVAASELVGPVYLFHLSAQAASESQASLVYLLGVISASLFFFNLIPLPILDGGQIMLTVVQKFMKRPLAPSSMRLLTGCSLVWLLAILGSATVNDVVRLLAA